MNDYYEEKREDSMEMTGYLCWLILIAAGIGTWYCTFRWVTHKCPEPLLPSLIDIQRRVGAAPDGVYGQETKECWEWAYANQEAAKFMTDSGAPRYGVTGGLIGPPEEGK